MLVNSTMISKPARKKKSTLPPANLKLSEPLHVPLLPVPLPPVPQPPPA